MDCTSLIMPFLPPCNGYCKYNGSIVTDTRANVHYLCTEYGCVNLKGLTSWEKAEALISVAHPDFREELIREAEKLHIWRRSNKI